MVGSYISAIHSTTGSFTSLCRGFGLRPVVNVNARVVWVLMFRLTHCQCLEGSLLKAAAKHRAADFDLEFCFRQKIGSKGNPDLSRKSCDVNVALHSLVLLGRLRAEYGPRDATAPAVAICIS